VIAVGIHEDSNANAAAVDGEGSILGAVAEGRLGRVKYQGGFPQRSLDWLAEQVLDGAPQGRQGNQALANTVTLAAGNRLHPIPRVLARFPDGHRDFRDPVQTAHVAWHELMHRSRSVRRVVEAVCRRGLRGRFGQEVDLFQHHTCHAASAYYTAPWPEATVVTCDNLGDGECARVFHGRDGQLEALWSVGAWHSPGQFYGEVASLLGIDPMTAGKVTGLAARGDANAALALLQGRLRISEDRRGFVGPAPSQRRRRASDWAALRSHRPEDLAAGAQKALEEALLPFVAEAVRATGCGHVALAGGVFANVTLNRLLAALPEVTSLWVHPAMSDQGIGLGAAFLAMARRSTLRPRPLDHVFLGPSWTPAECEGALRRAGLQGRSVRPPDIAAAAADLLVAGKVVARFDGAAEYGPRALGNRSILARPDDASVNDWLNERLHRSEYMPFAPVTLASPASDLFEGLDAVKPCLPFMTVSVRVKDPEDPRHSGVIHLDGTVRPQVLTAAGNPGLHRLLQAFHERTGIPSLVNTSFNLHGEPIVNTPDEAIATWRAAGLGGLILGPFLATQ